MTVRLNVAAPAITEFGVRLVIVGVGASMVNGRLLLEPKAVMIETLRWPGLLENTVNVAVTVVGGAAARSVT